MVYTGEASMKCAGLAKSQMVGCGLNTAILPPPTGTCHYTFLELLIPGKLLAIIIYEVSCHSEPDWFSMPLNIRGATSTTHFQSFIVDTCL